MYLFLLEGALEPEREAVDLFALLLLQVPGLESLGDVLVGRLCGCLLFGRTPTERERKKPTVNTLHSFIRPFKSVVGIPLNTDHKYIFFIITVHETIFWCNASWDCDKILNKNMNVVIFSLYKMYNYWQNFLQIDVLVNFS